MSAILILLLPPYVRNFLVFKYNPFSWLTPVTLSRMGLHELKSSYIVPERAFYITTPDHVFLWMHLIDQCLYVLSGQFYDYFKILGCFVFAG